MGDQLPIDIGHVEDLTQLIDRLLLDQSVVRTVVDADLPLDLFRFFGCRDREGGVEGDDRIDVGTSIGQLQGGYFQSRFSCFMLR